MKPHWINDQKNFISGWYINKELCDEIVNSCSGKNASKFNGRLKHTNKGYISANLKELSTDLHEKYVSELNNILDLYKTEYSFLRGVQPFALEKTRDKSKDIIQIQIYDPMCSYKELHSENAGHEQTVYRCLVFMTYLNDVNDQGGTHFPYQNFISKAEKGLTLMWPAYWTHPHCGIASPTEKKIITTGWYKFINDPLMRD